MNVVVVGKLLLARILVRNYIHSRLKCRIGRSGFCEIGSESGERGTYASAHFALRFASDKSPEGDQTIASGH